MADWKLPHHLQDTASIVRRNWLLTVMGAVCADERERGDSDVRDNEYPKWMTRHDQPDRRTR